MKILIVIMVFFLLPIMLFSAQLKPTAIPSKLMDITQIHDSGNYLFRISNYGTLGSGDDVVPQWPSLEYPRGSGIDFLYTGALWFGAKKQRRDDYGQMLFWQDPQHETTGTTNSGYGRVIDTLTTVGFDGDDDYYELLPAYNPLEEYFLGNQYALYNYSDRVMKYYSQDGILNYDDDGDGLIDEDPIGKIGFPYDIDSIFCFTENFDDDGDGLIDEDGGYFGYENLKSYFYDYSPFGSPGERVIESQSYAQNHIPLNIAISQETFCWPYQYFDKIALIKTTIYNINEQDTLFDFALGYYMDCDVGPQSWSSSARATDDVSSYIPGEGNKFAFTYDADHDNGLSNGYVAAKFSSNVDWAAFACWTWDVGDGPQDGVPNEDRNEKYWLMTHNSDPFSYKYISLRDDPNAQINYPCDTRFMYSYYGDQNGFTNPTVNSLNLSPGDSVVIYSAVFLGDTIDELQNISSILEQFDDVNYDINFINDFVPDLFFSEYIEGSSQNKALEIFNPTINQIELSNYRIAESVNGSGWQYWHEFPADAVIQPNDVWVITTNEADDSLKNVADEILPYPSLVYFNGDDARGLEKTTDGGTTWNLIDIIGNPDEDPGIGWDVAGIPEATCNHTIVRKESIFTGSFDWATSAGTNAETSEWNVYPMDTFRYLGWHNVGGIAPETYISTSQGNIDSLRVGSALNFELIGYPDAAYYKYRLAYYENLGTDTLFIGPLGNMIDSTAWNSTEEFVHSNELLLKSHYPEGNPYNKPLMRVNEKYPDGTYEVTQLQVKSVNCAGLEDSTSAKMTFFVRDYFYPETAPFMASWADLPFFLGGPPTAKLNILPHIYLLGENHYLEYMVHSPVSGHPIPSEIVNNETHFGNPFYVDANENFSAIWSQDMELHLWWSYLGEFEYSVVHGRIYAGNTYFYDENIDEYIRYFCDIEYMDIQLDGGTNGLPSIGSVIIDSLTNEEWMRVPITHDQSCMLTNLSIGEHTFKVRAIDIQGAIDPTPEELSFTLHGAVDASQSENILLVDDTQNSMIFAIEDSVNAFYQELISDFTGSVDWIDLQDLANVEVLNRGVRQHGGLDPYFAPSDIQSYKMILWYANDPKNSFYNDCNKVHLLQHYDILRYYLDQGGSLLFTGTANICDPVPYCYDLLEKYGGLADTLSALSQVLDENNWLWGNPSQENSMFVGAHGINDFTIIDPFNLNLHLYYLPNGIWFPESWVYGPLGKIGNITFLNPEQAETIFTCITDTMDIHQQFADAPVGTKYIEEPGETGAVYTLGFPLYYMEMDDAKTFMDLVYADLDSLFSIDDPYFVQDQPYIDILSYPNPVTLSSNNQTFSFNFKNIQNVANPKIKIYNIKGQLIKTIDIPKENLVVSKNSISSSTYWDFKDDQGKDISNGVYFYRVESKNIDSPIEKMVIIR